MQTKSPLMSPGKRCRVSPIDGEARSDERFSKTLRTEEAVWEQHSSCDRENTHPKRYVEALKSDTDYSHAQLDSREHELGILTSKQKGLLRQWNRDFGHPSYDQPPPPQRIQAIAAAIEASPELVARYIEDQVKDADAGQREDPKKFRYSDLVQQLILTSCSSDNQSLADANSHLSPNTLSLVEKYVAACRRRRSQTDGRRSVNKGPFRCTFGCGYETKRAFDWRRHEETHEPQELWLCDICRQRDTLNPFLVNRKDKFLRHVSDKHNGASVENVLEKSKVDFRPRAVHGCPMCELDKAWSWDERCKHVLGHFEVEMEMEARRSGLLTGQENETSTEHDGIVRSKSLSSGCSDKHDEVDGRSAGDPEAVADN